MILAIRTFFSFFTLSWGNIISLSSTWSAIRISFSNAPKALFKDFGNTDIYTTKGRDRLHWAATPLIPYKVENICYMTYRYSVLYFLNLSLKHFFPTENGNFCENTQIRRPLSFLVLTRSRMPNRRTSQPKIEDIVHCKCISLLN